MVKINTQKSTWRANSEYASRQKASRKRWQLFRKRIVLTLGIIVVTQLAIAGWIVYRTGELALAKTMVIERLYGVSVHAGFALETIHIEGLSALSKNDVMRALDVYSGQPLFAVSLKNVKGDLERMADIRSARVERLLPDTLHITVQEREAFAIWQKDGVHHYIDRDGTVLKHAVNAAGKSLPVLVGSDALEHTQSFMAMLESVPSLRHQVKAAVRVGGRRWNVHLQHDEVVKLPADTPEVAWKKLADLHEQKQLLHKKLSVIDMRLPDRLLVTYPEQEQQNMKKVAGQHEAI